MATHSSILAWKIPWMEPGRHSPWGRKELDMTEPLHFTSLQAFCQEIFKVTPGRDFRLQGGRGSVPE